MRKFAIFQPPDENVQLQESSAFKQQNMVRSIDERVNNREGSIV